MNIRELDPSDLQTAYEEWTRGSHLVAVVEGLPTPANVIEVSRENYAYLVEHWENVWIPAKRVKSLLARLPRQPEMKAADIADYYEQIRKARESG